MYRRTQLIGLLILLPLWHLQAQSTPADSLKKVVLTQRDDSVKVLNLISISTVFLTSDVNEAFRYAGEARLLAEKIKFQRGKALALKSIGQGFMNQGNFAKALLQFQEALAVFDSIGHKAGKANILSNIGAVYFNTGDDAKAIDFYLQSLRYSEEIGDQLRIGTAYNNVGGVYNNKPATVDKGLEYFQKALSIFTRINYDDGVATVAMNIGEIYQDKKLYDSAIYYFEASIKIYHGTVDATFPLTHLGQIYAEEGEFEKALRMHGEAVSIAESLDARFELTQSLLGMAETYARQGKIEQAVQRYLQAEKIADAIKAKNQLKAAYGALAKSYARMGDFRKAYTYEAQYTSIKDTLYNNSNDKKIQQLQFNFDIEKKEAEIDILTKDQELKDATIQRQKIITYATSISGFLLLLMAVGTYNRYKFIRKTNKIIKEERDRSKELLLNILPEETARELETQGSAKARYYENVTVLFTDFKGFSTIAGKLTPQDLVAELNYYFMAFDDIVGKYNLEKIKTIGDAYMCAGGIPTTNETHAIDAVRAALAMQDFMKKKNREWQQQGLTGWELRIGIHTGPIVSGVVGKKKYAYDIWGDTVNIASRMESGGEPGWVNVSASTYAMIKHQYTCIHRGKIMAKNIGEVDMYFIDPPAEEKV